MTEHALRYHSLDTVWLNTFLPQSETDYLQSDGNIAKLQSEYDYILQYFELFLQDFSTK